MHSTAAARFVATVHFKRVKNDLKKNVIAASTIMRGLTRKTAVPPTSRAAEPSDDQIGDND